MDATQCALAAPRRLLGHSDVAAFPAGAAVNGITNHPFASHGVFIGTGPDPAETACDPPPWAAPHRCPPVAPAATSSEACRPVVFIPDPANVLTQQPRRAAHSPEYRCSLHPLKDWILRQSRGGSDALGPADEKESLAPSLQHSRLPSRCSSPPPQAQRRGSARSEEKHQQSSGPRPQCRHGVHWRRVACIKSHSNEMTVEQAARLAVVCTDGDTVKIIRFAQPHANFRAVETVAIRNRIGLPVKTEDHILRIARAQGCCFCPREGLVVVAGLGTRLL